ncbi:MAG: hypothetical protein DMG21_06090 [Acidobacteria bacterium]|nr:MAG: hypothetical protein DMG21_06090 [Acidobacteriota bacterium]
MNIPEALRAICSTHEGYCWFCDSKLPAAESAIAEGWDVQRVAGDRVASIILVCPACLRKKAKRKRVSAPPLPARIQFDLLRTRTPRGRVLPAGRA